MAALSISVGQHLPGIALALGAAGAGAIILTSALIVNTGQMGFLRHFGENSIVIYLAFFFPMGVTRVILAEARHSRHRHGLIDRHHGCRLRQPDDPLSG